MLSQKNRLKKESDINKVFSRGKFLSCDFLSFKYIIPPDSKNPPRLAFSVGVNYSPKAVERNYFKRILRSVSRKHLETLPLGLDGVFFLNKSKLPTNLKNAKEKLPFLAEFILKNLNKKINR